MSEIATLKRMAASDEYSATETAIFDGAVTELSKARELLAHMNVCAICADDWMDCKVGREALQFLGLPS